MIPVFYDPKAVSIQASYSPSGHKPKLIADHWRKRFKDDVKFYNHGSLSPMDVARAHEFNYVKGVLALDIRNAFGTATEDVARSLLYACGGMYAAASHVLDQDNEDMVACVPYGGFSHAAWDHNRSHCTFNGIMTTAMCMVESYQVDNLLVLDCNYQFGDGTQDIIDRNPSDFTGFVRHWSAGERFHTKKDTAEFMHQLAEVLAKNRRVGLIIYQAGADQHLADGGFLTKEQLRLRDKMVFDFARAYQIPLVWNIGGGYQTPVQKVLKIHEGTLLEALLAYV